MANIRKIEVDGIEYSIYDESAHSQIDKLKGEIPFDLIENSEGRVLLVDKAGNPIGEGVSVSAKIDDLILEQEGDENKLFLSYQGETIGNGVVLPATGGGGGFLPLTGGTLAGNLIFENQSTQIKAYNIVLKNIESNNALSYPCTKFYQTGNKWVVNACDEEGTSQKEVFSINLNTNIATFLDRPTVNGEKIALVSDFSGVFLTADELPQDGVPLVNIFYFLGELNGEELTITLPSDAVPGDMIYLSYSTGATQPNVTVVGDAIGLSNLTNLTYRSYELMGLWNGEVWLFVVREVGL